MHSHILEAQEASREFHSEDLKGLVLVFHANQNVTATKGNIDIIYYKGIPQILPKGKILAVYSDRVLPESIARNLEMDVVVSDG